MVMAGRCENGYGEHKLAGLSRLCDLVLVVNGFQREF